MALLTTPRELRFYDDIRYINLRNQEVGYYLEQLKLKNGDIVQENVVDIHTGKRSTHFYRAAEKRELAHVCMGVETYAWVWRGEPVANNLEVVEFISKWQCPE